MLDIMICTFDSRIWDTEVATWTIQSLRGLHSEFKMNNDYKVQNESNHRHISK